MREAPAAWQGQIQTRDWWNQPEPRPNLTQPLHIHISHQCFAIESTLANSCDRFQ
jgi:hypothetical protein